MKEKTLRWCCVAILILFIIVSISMTPSTIIQNPHFPPEQFIVMISILVGFFVMIIILILQPFSRSKKRSFIYMNDEDQIRFLLNRGECEYLDYKISDYHLNSNEQNEVLIHKKEFIKDVLGLINNKTRMQNTGMAFLMIGIDETNGIYNGKHFNIDHINEQTYIQSLINHILPKLRKIEIKEYFISGYMNLSMECKEGFHRNYLIELTYDIGTVYEINKQIGNKKVGFHYKGMSWTREKSYTEYLTQDDRAKIMVLKKKFITIRRIIHLVRRSINRS